MTEQQFTQSVACARDKLFRIAWTILHNEQDCSDALQEALLRAWQNLGKLRQEQYFDTWLVRILINECKRIHVSRRRIAPLLTAPPALPVEDESLHDAIKALDEKYRLPIVLHYLEGYSLEEIAYLLRVPMGTVKSRMFTGRRLLKDLLEEESSCAIN